MGSKQRWGASAVASVTQVTKTNFTGAVERIKDHIQQSDYIAISAQKTGGARRPWHRVLPIDTPRIAYLKAKLAAEAYELLQLAVCPFRIDGSKVVAFPYNFHLFPRDEMNMGLPSYSFACQSSFLTSMAREGLDFNECIYNGISYLSRVQESKVKDYNTTTNGVKLLSPAHSSISNTAAADKIFMERITSRVQHWKNACTTPTKLGEDALMASLRKLIVGGELHGSRPCLSIDVCSSRQVQLIAQALNESFDDLVPVVLSDRCGSPKAVRVILTVSENDKKQLVDELQCEDEKRSKTLRGFREVIDLMSISHKPIISNDCLYDFAFIHSKFIAPLPASMAEFTCSLKLAFSDILDMKHLLKEVGPLRKANNLAAALSYLRRKFPLPTLLEIPRDNDLPYGTHGHNVLRITQVFAKLCSILNSGSDEISQASSLIEDYGYIFHPCPTLDELEEDDIGLWNDNAQRVSSDNLVFIWGFREEISTSELKTRLHGTHDSFLEDFEVTLIEKGCAVLVFRKPGLAAEFLKDMETGKTDSASLVDLISCGLKATGYEAYKRVCISGLWDMDLVDSLEQSLLSLGHDSSDLMQESLDIYWHSKLIESLNCLKCLRS